jgi:hypothetical protein
MSAEDLANDVNVVALWTSVDGARWAAGLVSGWIAGVIAMAVAGLIAINHGYQFVFPVKLLGTCLLGAQATAYDSHSGLMAGAAVCAFIFGLWGFVYGHFVRSNSLYSLLGMGFTWGAFLWIFDWNLILHSVKTISASEVPSGAAFATCMAYGFGMSVIAIVEPIFKGGRR